MNSLDNSTWRCQYLCRRTKLRVIKALIMPGLLYGTETWTLSFAFEPYLDAFCNRSLCRIMGFCWRDHVSNQWLHRETGTGPVTYTLRDRQLRLHGHLASFPQADPAHQVVSVRDNLGWRRPVGRHRKSWLGQIDQTCREEFKSLPGCLSRGTPKALGWSGSFPGLVHELQKCKHTCQP
ncbi:uncharacterized protein [Penaeus vannamei]|uniref:uncharacterized protein n=1 Tax=Penaeus vannamei TaxID=6689 RepID=UPI00387F5B35